MAHGGLTLEKFGTSPNKKQVFLPKGCLMTALSQVIAVFLLAEAVFDTCHRLYNLGVASKHVSLRSGCTRAFGPFGVILQ